MPFQFKTKYEKALAVDADMAQDYNFPKYAWQQATSRMIYHSKTNGLVEPLPDIFLIVPTRGGKTLIACLAIYNIQKSYLHRTLRMPFALFAVKKIRKISYQYLESSPPSLNFEFQSTF